MTTDEIRDFKEAVGRAAWKLDLWTFATAMGAESSHEYTQDKFRQLSNLNKALGQFDVDTLARILAASEGTL